MSQQNGLYSSGRKERLTSASLAQEDMNLSQNWPLGYPERANPDRVGTALVSRSPESRLSRCIGRANGAAEGAGEADSGVMRPRVSYPHPYLSYLSHR